jgi:hypothetical protein
MSYPRWRPGDVSTGIVAGDHAFSTKTADYSMLVDDDIVLADGTSASVDVTLPAPASCTNHTYTIKAINITNAVRLLPNASEKIDGASTYTFRAAYEAITVITDGTNWFLLNNSHNFKDIYAENVFYTQALYHDYLVPGTTLALGATAPDLTVFRGNVDQLAFAGTGGTVEEAFFSIHILHDIKAGTYPTFHVHFAHIIDSGSYTAGTNSVVWQIEYSVASGYGNGTFPAPRSLSSTTTVQGQYVHHISSDDDMVMSSPDDIEPDSLVLGRVFRDPAHASDDFANDVFLLQLDMHVQLGQIGSEERNRPFTSIGF